MGTLYNPLSIHRILHFTVHNELPLPATYVENQGIWSNYEFHSSFSATTKGEVEKKISTVHKKFPYETLEKLKELMPLILVEEEIREIETQLTEYA